MRDVNSVMADVATSVAESMPSPNTATLPEMSPTTIFRTDSTAFPMTPAHDALNCIFSLSFKKVFALGKPQKYYF